MAIREKANNAALKGGVTEIAGDPNEIEVAGVGSKIFKLLFSDAAEDMASSITKADPTIPKKEKAAPRVPTEIEESFLSPKRQTYSKTQDYHAKRMLSKEGYARFKKQDMQGKLTEKEAEAEEVLELAKKALKDADNEAPFAETRIAPESAYDDIKSLRNKESILRVDSKEGIDFNFDKIETNDDIKEIINAISDEYADVIKTAKRGVKTHKETRAEAEELLLDEIGLTKKLFAKKRGALMNAGELTAVRILMNNSAKKLNELTKQIEALDLVGNVDSKLLLNFRRQQAIHAAIAMQVKGSQTEAARAVNALKIPVGFSPKITGDMIKEMLDSAGGANLTIKMAKGYREALKNGQRAANNYAYEGWWGTTKDIFNEVYVNGLLGWTTTYLKNIIATPAFHVYQTGEELLAASFGKIEKGIRTVSKRPGDDEGALFGEIAATYYGNIQSIRDMFVVAGRTFKTEIPAMASTKAENLQYQALNPERIKFRGKKLNELDDQIYGQGVYYLGRTIRLPGRGLQSGDDFWKTSLMRGELHRQAYLTKHNALRLGKSIEEANEDAMMVLLDPKSVAKELKDAAEYTTLTTPLSRNIKQIISSIQRHPLGRVAIPFAMVPTNAVIRHAERNPLFLALNPRLWDDMFNKGPRIRQRTIARLSLGAATMTSLAYYAMEGRFTGAYPKNKNEQDRLPTNWQPFSARFRVGDWPKDEDGDPLPILDNNGIPNGDLYYVNYSGFEPVGAVIAVGVDAAERMRRSDDPEIHNNIALAAAIATSNYFTELPFLQTMGDLTKAFMYEDIDYLTEGPLSNTIGPIPIPFSAAQKRVAKFKDPKRTKISTDIEYYTKEDIYAMGPGEDGLYNWDYLGRVKSDNFFSEFIDKTWKLQTKDSLIFGSAETEENEAIQYDVFGEQMDNSVRWDENHAVALWNMITPFKMTLGEKPNALQAELIRIGMPLQRKKTKLLNRIALSEKQQSQWTEIAKKTIKLSINGRTPMGFVDALTYRISKVDYINAPLKEKQNIINNIEEKFYKESINTLLSLPGNAELNKIYNQVLNQKEVLDKYIY
jgi:hypothetical protein